MVDVWEGEVGNLQRRLKEAEATARLADADREMTKQSLDAVREQIKGAKQQGEQLAALVDFQQRIQNERDRQMGTLSGADREQLGRIMQQEERAQSERRRQLRALTEALVQLEAQEKRLEFDLSRAKERLRSAEQEEKLLATQLKKAAKSLEAARKAAGKSSAAAAGKRPSTAAASASAAAKMALSGAMGVPPPYGSNDGIHQARYDAFALSDNIALTASNLIMTAMSAYISTRRWMFVPEVLRTPTPEVRAVAQQVLQAMGNAMGRAVKLGEVPGQPMNQRVFLQRVQNDLQALATALVAWLNQGPGPSDRPLGVDDWIYREQFLHRASDSSQGVNYTDVRNNVATLFLDAALELSP